MILKSAVDRRFFKPGTVIRGKKIRDKEPARTPLRYSRRPVHPVQLRASPRKFRSRSHRPALRGRSDMLVKPKCVVCEVPFFEDLRVGQEKVVRLCDEEKRTKLTAQLPTGYGKTLAGCGAFSVLKRAGRVDRMLWVVPTDAQRSQFCSGAKSDLGACSVDGNRRPFSCQNWITAEKRAKDHRADRTQVFCTTIQAIFDDFKNENGKYAKLLSHGRWLVVVDEFHHYGLDTSWTKAITSLDSEFVLAMSATPYRKHNDSAFPEPEVQLTYEQAYEEGAVKRMQCHSYVYVIDVEKKGSGECETYDLYEFQERMGNSYVEIDKKMMRENYRFLPKYISPLIREPLSRLNQITLETGGRTPQALVVALSCIHAELVCNQIRSLYPNWRIDWCGTGPEGRTPEENEDVLKKFCPEKRADGRRHDDDIELDVLVTVNMAGEGLDTTNVCEVIHCCHANFNNRTHQANGRGARVMNGATCTINVDSTSPFHDHQGDAVMKVMDVVDKEKAPVSSDDPESFDPKKDKEKPSPDDPVSRVNIRLKEIQRGEEEEMRSAFQENYPNMVEYFDTDAGAEKLEQWILRQRDREARQNDDPSMVARMKTQNRAIVGKVASMVVRRKCGIKTKLDKTMLGDICHAINSRKLQALGRVQPNVESLEEHYHWVRALEAEILALEGGIPKWLA